MVLQASPAVMVKMACGVGVAEPAFQLSPISFSQISQLDAKQEEDSADREDVAAAVVREAKVAMPERQA
jgi:hypothetical protein